MYTYQLSLATMTITVTSYIDVLVTNSTYDYSSNFNIMLADSNLMQKALKMDTSKMTWHILATVFIVSAQFQGGCSHTLYVKPTTADTNTVTLCQRVQGPCLTLSDYLQSSNCHFPNTSNTNVVFLPGNHTLSETVPYVHVANISNISLTGSYNPTSHDFHVIIYCRRKLSFVFADVYNLQLAQISFVACGAEVPQKLSNSALHPRSYHFENDTFLIKNGTYAALVFANVHDLTMQNVTVSRSYGYGMLGLNVLGSSSIVDSAFLFNNWWQSSHIGSTSSGPSNNKVPAGGNAMLLYSDTEHNPQYNSLPLHSMYISNVTLAHGIDTTIPEYHNISYYVQGGASGLILEMGQESYKLNVTIHKISLIENLGEHVAGGFIHDFGNVQNLIQITQSRFVNGKGLYFWLLSPKQKANNADISVSGCVFRGNKDTGLHVESLLGKSGFTKFNQTILISNNQFSKHGFVSNVDHKSTPAAAFQVNVLILDCVYSNVKLILGIVSCSFHHNMVSATRINVSESSECPQRIATATKNNVYMAFDSCLFHNNISPKYSVLFISLHANTQMFFDLFLQTYQIVSRVQFSNVSIHHNSAPNSIIHIDFIHHIIFTNCVIASNMGTGIFARKSIITFQGNNTLANNSGIDGGAIALQQSIISLRPRTHLQLSSNRAKRYGGGIFQDEIVIPFSSGALINLAKVAPLGVCTIQLYGWRGNVSEISSLNAFIMMDNNTAEVAGDSIYGALLDQCYLLDESRKSKTFLGAFLSHSIKFMISLADDNVDVDDLPFHFGFMMLGPVVGKGSGDVYTPVIKIKDADPTKTLPTVVTEPYKLCPCSENDIKCDVSEHPDEIQAYPGETFYVSLSAVGQFNNPSPATIFSEVCLTSHICLYSKYLHITAQQRIQLVGRKCTNIPYTVSTAKSSAVIRISIRHESFLAKVSKGSSAYIIHVKLLPCPFGFQLSTDPAQCKCTQWLAHKGAECDINTHRLHKPVGSWIGTTENNISKTILFHTHCPFNFCKDSDTSVSLQGPDEQCAFNRSGVLCGSCEPGLSLALGTSQCLQCPNTYLLLIIPFALAGVGLVLLLLKCNLTVSVGTNNGLIFYANIVRANQAIFFPHGTRSGVTTFFSVFIAWINLDLGIETCFFHGMDAKVKAWLNFAFPIYVCVIITLMIILSQYSSVVSKLTGSNAVSVLSTLFLLSYAKLLRSVIATFSFTSLVYSDGTQHKVWLHDGNVKFLTVQHSLLFAFALIVSLFCIVPLTVIVLLAPTCLEASYCRRLLRWLHKLRPLLDAYQKPYKDKFRHWPGVLLMVRVILLVTFACNANENSPLNLVAITITVLVLLLLCWNFRQVYKNYLLSITESFFLVNLGFLSSYTLFFKSPPLESKNRSLVIVNISVGLSFVAFCIILFYHCYQQLKMISPLSRIVFRLKTNSRRCTQQQPPSQTGNSGVTMPGGSDTVNEFNAQNAVTFSVVELSELSPAEDFISQNDTESGDTEAAEK